MSDDRAFSRVPPVADGLPIDARGTKRTRGDEAQITVAEVLAGYGEVYNNAQGFDDDEDIWAEYALVTEKALALKAPELQRLIDELRDSERPPWSAVRRTMPADLVPELQWRTTLQPLGAGEGRPADPQESRESRDSLSLILFDDEASREGEAETAAAARPCALGLMLDPPLSGLKRLHVPIEAGADARRTPLEFRPLGPVRRAFPLGERVEGEGLARANRMLSAMYYAPIEVTGVPAYVRSILEDMYAGEQVSPGAWLQEASEAAPLRFDSVQHLWAALLVRVPADGSVRRARALFEALQRGGALSPPALREVKTGKAKKELVRALRSKRPEKREELGFAAGMRLKREKADQLFWLRGQGGSYAPALVGLVADRLLQSESVREQLGYKGYMRAEELDLADFKWMHRLSFIWQWMLGLRFSQNTAHADLLRCTGADSLLLRLAPEARSRFYRSQAEQSARGPVFYGAQLLPKTPSSAGDEGLGYTLYGRNMLGNWLMQVRERLAEDAA
jgi:hypothetical protein